MQQQASQEEPTRRLSQIPFAIFARVLASSGAITIMSAHRRNSMWSIGSVRSLHICKQANNTMSGYINVTIKSLQTIQCQDTSMSPSSQYCTLYLLLVSDKCKYSTSENGVSGAQSHKVTVCDYHCNDNGMIHGIRMQWHCVIYW